MLSGNEARPAYRLYWRSLLPFTAGARERHMTVTSCLSPAPQLAANYWASAGYRLQRQPLRHITVLVATADAA